ncbi:MAG: hypothetical protein LBB79_08525 [Prevotellaceae bacterium]|nr:hypothetical protein [Prevotellaceae bacterium]
MAKHAHKETTPPSAGPKKAGKPAGKKRPVAAPAPPQSPKHPMLRWLGGAFGFKSMALAVVGGLLFYGAAHDNSGYQWVWTNLLKGNWDFIQKHRKATLDERYQMKLGFDYVFCSYVRDNTPEDAVILFPLKKYNTEKGGDYQLTRAINVKNWVTHFVYPRKALYKDEQETNPRYHDVTHVAIIAGHGYEDLDYPVRERSYFTVLPKKAQTVNSE